MVARLRDLAYESGSPLLKGTLAGDHGEAEQRLRDRAAAALVIIPADFSAQLAAFRSGDTRAGADLTFVGDLTNPTYTVAAGFAGGIGLSGGASFSPPGVTWVRALTMSDWIRCSWPYPFPGAGH